MSSPVPTSRRDVPVPAAAVTLGPWFSEAGFDLVVVGGTARDLLSGVAPADVDCATDATPQQVTDLLADHFRVLPTGIDHGTVTVLVDDVAVEVTTFRGDVYDGESRRPEVTFTDTFDADASRRDFTVNAIGVRVATGELLDPTGGIADLQLGLLRACGDPAARFTDDPLRVVRMVRFAATRPFGIDRDTLLAVGTARRAMDMVAVERVTAELDKVIMAGRPGALRSAALLAGDLGLNRALFGNLSPSLLVNVTPRSAAAAAVAAVQGDRAAAYTCLAWPLHPTRRRAALAARRLPAALVDTVVAACAAADDLPGRWDVVTARRLVRSNAAAAAALSVAGPVVGLDGDDVARVAAAVAEADRWTSALPISGHDLSAAGLAPGPSYRPALQAATDRWLADPDTDPDVLLRVALAAA